MLFYVQYFVMHIVMTLILRCHSTTTITTITMTSTVDRLKTSACKNLLLITLPGYRQQMHAAVKCLSF